MLRALSFSPLDRKPASRAPTSLPSGNSSSDETPSERAPIHPAASLSHKLEHPPPVSSTFGSPPSHGCTAYLQPARTPWESLTAARPPRIPRGKSTLHRESYKRSQNRKPRDRANASPAYVALAGICLYGQPRRTVIAPQEPIWPPAECCMKRRFSCLKDL